MTDPSHQDEPSIDVDRVFRPAKRRKFYRKRPSEDDSNNNSVSPNGQPESTGLLTIDELILHQGVAPADTEAGVESHGDNGSSSVTELLRLRKAAAQRKRGGGVEFSNLNGVNHHNVPKSSQANGQLPENDDTIASIEKKVVNRFAPQTGLVADVDKHMYVFLPP